MESWGLSCSVDVEGCDIELISSAAHIQDYAIQLCKLIDMKRYNDCQVVHFGTGDKMGYTLVQLIETSCITAHFSEDTKTAYVDIFSCKEYDPEQVRLFTLDFFKGKIARCSALFRGHAMMNRDNFYDQTEKESLNDCAKCT